MIFANDTTKRFKKQKLVNEKVFWGLKRNDSKTPKLYLRKYTKKVTATGLEPRTT